MVWVKICGITSEADAACSVEAGADALGFTFYAPSPRAIEPEQARAIIAGLPDEVTPVGLFVDAPLEEVRRLAALCGFRTVQLHGEEAPAYCHEVGLEVIKAVRVRDAGSLAALADYEVAAFLLDAFSPDRPGGTGTTFDHGLVEAAKASGRPIIVAGGLTPETVSAVVRATRPYGVDVATGVEAAPGVKDPTKVRAFVERAKAAEGETSDEA
ncbi:MAG: phosphoribosylanthranilate isomerase [Nitrospinota bacterium]